MRRTVSGLVAAALLAGVASACSPAESSLPPTGTTIVLRADLSAVPASDVEKVMNEAVTVVKARAEAGGNLDATVERQGTDQILVRVASAVGKSFADSIARQSLLEFGELVEGGGPARWENELGRWQPATATIDGQTLELTSAYFQDNTYVTTSETTGEVILTFSWNTTGAQLSTQITARLLNQRLGIFEGDQALRSADGQPFAPVVMATITDSGVIEGLAAADARRLSRQLNAGRLPVPLSVVDVQVVD